MKSIIHYMAGYLSVMGLGVLFSVLLTGAVQFAVPLAVFMFVCAVVSIATNPTKTGG